MPITQQSLVEYQYVCRSNCWFVGRPPLTLQEKITQHIPKSIWNNEKLTKVLSRPGFLNQWAIGDWFCSGPHSYLKNWLLGSKKSYFSYVYWRIDKNQGLRCADLFFEDQSKNCSPRREDLFFIYFFGDQGKNCFPRSEDLFLEIRAITVQATLTWRGELFFKAEGLRAMVQQQWSTEHWAMQTFKKHETSHGSEKVENHWPRRNCKAKTTLNQLECDSAIGLHLLQNPDWAAHHHDRQLSISAKARTQFYLAALKAIFIKTQQPSLCWQKEFIYSLQFNNN